MAQFGESTMVVNVPRGQSGITPEECKHVGFPKTSETKKQNKTKPTSLMTIFTCARITANTRGAPKIYVPQSTLMIDAWITYGFFHPSFSTRTPPEPKWFFPFIIFSVAAKFIVRTFYFDFKSHYVQ